VTASPTWTGTIVCRCPTPEMAERLARSLGPEAVREVPRARAEVQRGAEGEVRILLSARDTGALRAAVQTYLGWLRLAEATEAVASLPDDDGTP
jgi:tRNA threonylcarbamoyladenosine modification (KEOPS) complex  Pcc1 subunit